MGWQGHPRTRVRAEKGFLQQPVPVEAGLAEAQVAGVARALLARVQGWLAWACPASKGQAGLVGFAWGRRGHPTTS